MTRPRKVRVDRALVLPIVGDGAIASGAFNGRLVPVVLVDIARHPAIAEVIRRHVDEPGDANSCWGRSKTGGSFAVLELDFLRPVKTKVYLEFAVPEDHMLVELVLSAKAITLLPAKKGDRLRDHFDDPSVTVEVPRSVFIDEWDALLIGRLTKQIRRQRGLSTRAARDAAKKIHSEVRMHAEQRLIT